MATISLLITSAPFDSDSSVMAPYYKAKQLISDGHKLQNVFFYLQGVYHAIPSAVRDAQGLTPYIGWCDIHEQQDTRLMVCISAANQRGLSDSTHAEEYGQLNIITAPFEQVGLGEFFTQLHHCDELIQLS